MPFVIIIVGFILGVTMGIYGPILFSYIYDSIYPPQGEFGIAGSQGWVLMIVTIPFSAMLTPLFLLNLYFKRKDKILKEKTISIEQENQKELEKP